MGNKIQMSGKWLRMYKFQVRKLKMGNHFVWCQILGVFIDYDFLMLNEVTSWARLLHISLCIAFSMVFLVNYCHGYVGNSG